MKISILRISVASLLFLSVAGCATSSKKPDELGMNVHKMHMKALGDQEALALFERVYNYDPKTPVDRKAKDITVTAFMSALDYRCSKVIADSGVFQRPYNKVELGKWSDEELLDFYNSLYRKRVESDTGPEVVNEIRDVDGKIYWTFSDAPEEEIEKEDTQEIIQLTALYAVDGERDKRSRTKGAWKATGNAIATGVNVAARVAMMLAGFLLV
ncbi:MAG: hypothetical protein GF409_01075 [Candidatus Omnitrophica bacterium]|nr:hypothetical protein [Candidatus Omnitrophota bacterium]